MGYDAPFTYARLKLPLSHTATSILSWATLYIVVLQLCKSAPERASRIVALIHGLFVVSHAYYVVKEGTHDFSNPGTKNTHHETTLICMTLGYFIYDYGWMVYYKHQEGFILFIHHLLSIVTFTLVLVKGSSAAETIAGIIMFELTNPLLQIRWLMRDFGYKETTLFTIVDMTFIVMFFLCRMFWGMYFTYVILAHPKPGLDIKLCTVGLLMVSWHLMAMVGKYGYYKYIATPESEEEPRNE